MLKKAFVSIFAGAFLLLGMQAHAGIITLTPSTEGMIAGNTLTPPTGTANCEVGCVNLAFELSGDDLLTTSDLLYKADQVNNAAAALSGSFAASYSTVFANTPNDPQEATITWLGSSFISCPSCYLAIKDGNATPSYYFFNLSNIPASAATEAAQTPIWDGKDTIQLTAFWPQQGAISHVSIWGKLQENGNGNGNGGGGGGSIPEPASLGLLGLGLLAMGAIRRRKVALKR